MTDPFAVAAEHAAWCIREGWHPYDVFEALGQPPPQGCLTWNEAIWAIAKAAGDLNVNNGPTFIAGM